LIENEQGRMILPWLGTAALARRDPCSVLTLGHSWRLEISNSWPYHVNCFFRHNSIS
jgi:hypothetical protein